MKSLNHYLSLATKGDATAAFEAAKIMYHEKYSEVITQAMLRKAGELGSVDAQRWLGFIGLANKLIEPDSTASNVKYCKDASVSFQWFKKAAIAGDVISTFAVYKCLQLGIGTPKNVEKAKAVFSTISSNLTFDVIPLMLFFDTYHAPQETLQTAEHKSTIRTILAS